MSDPHSDAALVDEVYALARPYFKNDQVTWDWMARPIPAFLSLTPVQYAREEGVEALRQHLARFFSGETTA